MGSLLLAAVAALALFLMLALFARGGPTETIRPEDSKASLGALTLQELASVTSRLFSEFGFALMETHPRPDFVDLRMKDPTPVTGQTVYIRCLLTPSAGAVESSEVQAAADTARHEQMSKAVVVTSGPFSDEARLLARDTSLELIDGQALSGLLRAHLADVANRLGMPR